MARVLLCCTPAAASLGMYLGLTGARLRGFDLKYVLCREQCPHRPSGRVHGPFGSPRDVCVGVASLSAARVCDHRPCPAQRAAPEPPRPARRSHSNGDQPPAVAWPNCWRCSCAPRHECT